jgi:hypothetical protein
MRRKFAAAGGLTAGATLAMSGVAQAVPMTFTVGSLDDTLSASDCATPTNTDCTLRDAISAANLNTGADTIVFKTGLTGTITMADDPQAIAEGVSIQGPGASQVTVDGDDTYRTFELETAIGDPVAISGLTLTNAYTQSSGAAIYNYGSDLTVANSVITDSYATDSSGGDSGNIGGGVYSNKGPVTLDHSTVSGNHGYYGGGVASGTGNTTIMDSSVTDNYADGDQANSGNDGYGGGLWSDGADLTVIRSTLYNNTAAYDGGGIYASDSSGSAVTIINSTIVDNHAANDDAGGVYDNGDGNMLTVISSTVSGNTAATDGGGLKAVNLDASPVLENSIVSGNTSGTDPNTADLEASGSYIFDTSFSLIGVPDVYVHETVPGSNLTGVDPQLGGLGNNGGPTETLLPATSSPVVDKGKAFNICEDQRSLFRPVDLPDHSNSTAAGADGSDMGAVELQTSPSPGGACPVPSSGGPPPPTKHKKKCKKKKKHKRSAESAKKKKCKKKKKK